MIQDAQGDEHVEPLAVGGSFVQRDAVPVLGEGFHPFRAMLREILAGSSRRPFLWHGRRSLRQVLRGRSDSPAGLGDDLQGVCHPLRPEQLPRQGRAAAGKKGCGKIGKVSDIALGVGDHFSAVMGETMKPSDA